MPRPTVGDRIADALDAIAKIRRHTAGLSAEAYGGNELLAAAVERWLLIVSEAVRHIPPELSRRHPEVPWRNVADFGNVLRHAYDQVLDHRVWSVVEDHLPALEAALRSLAREA